MGNKKYTIKDIINYNGHNKDYNSWMNRYKKHQNNEWMLENMDNKFGREQHRIIFRLLINNQLNDNNLELIYKEHKQKCNKIRKEKRKLNIKLNITKEGIKILEEAQAKFEIWSSFAGLKNIMYMNFGLDINTQLHQAIHRLKYIDTASNKQ